MVLSIYLGIVLCIAIDQLVKWWTVSTFALHSGVSLIDGIFSLYYIRNDGAAWGILSGNQLFFYIITVIFVGGYAWWFHKSSKWAIEKFAYVLIIAGALGNFIDRVYLGYVIDMFKLDFIQFPIFNVADVYLTCGVGLILIETFFLEGKHD